MNSSPGETTVSSCLVRTFEIILSKRVLLLACATLAFSAGCAGMQPPVHTYFTPADLDELTPNQQGARNDWGQVTSLQPGTPVRLEFAEIEERLVEVIDGGTADARLRRLLQDEFEGEHVESTEEGLTIRPRVGATLSEHNWRIAREDIGRILAGREVNDSIWEGALLGAAAGLFIPLVLIASEEDIELSGNRGLLLATGAPGFAAGALIDWRMKDTNWTVVYEAGS